MQALDTLESLSVPQKEAHLQLKAQLLYRLGDFDAAIKIYQEVVSEKGVRIHKYDSVDKP